jgi:hypothetical protein
MKQAILIAAIFFSSVLISSAQDIIKGLPVTISLVPKSAKQPGLKLKDGAGILLKYNADDGIHVILAKNGKQTDFCEPFSNTIMVQVGEVDIDKDGKPEVVVTSRSSSATIEILIFKKAEFEVNYKEWSSFTGTTAVEFPGNGTVRLYEPSGKYGTYKFTSDGKISETD